MSRPGVVLVIPPMAKACEPDPAALVLAGHLEARNIAVRVVDANLRFQQALADPVRLSRYAERVCRPEIGARETIPAASAHRAVSGLPRAAACLTGQAAYTSPAGYRAAVNTLAEGYRLVSRALGVQLTISDFVHPRLSPLRSGDLAASAGDPDLLGTADLLAPTVEEILRSRPTLVGISVTYLSQALHGFALAGLLRRAGYGGTLLLGGGLVGSWIPRLTADSPVFGPWDGLVAGPGEEALEAAARSGGVADAPGVLAPRLGIRRLPQRSTRGEVGFEPHVDTLPWREYLAPSPVLPLTASRGCYWARCAFCPEAAGAMQPYQPADPERLASSILRARDRHGIRYAHFTDNALSPTHLRRLAEALKGEGIGWYGFTRIEPQLADPAFLQLLARGGCGMLQLGIETASPRLLARMGKGTDVELAARVVEGAAEAGIRVYGYFLFGLPTETEEEARRTAEWIGERGGRISFLNLSIMNFPRDGEMEKTPERFGVDGLKPLDGRNDLSLYWGYDASEGIDRARVRRILGEAKRDPAIRRALQRTPRGFSANHALFAPL